MALQFIANLIPGPRIQLDVEFGGYRVTVPYTATGIGATVDVVEDRPTGVFDEATYSTPQSHIAESFTVRHPATDQWGSTFTQNCYCYVSTMDVKHTTTAGTALVDVLYEGRLLGTHRCTTRTQMMQETIRQSLELGDDGITYPSIGEEFEGTQRDVPMQVFTCEHCIVLTDLDNYQKGSQYLAGTVNEDSWEEPWTSAGVVAEAQYLYLGLAGVTVDRPTRTAMVVHDFARIPNRERQDSCDWMPKHSRENQTTHVAETYFDPADTVTAKIQLIAGTDSAYTFADLDLGKPIF
jgi:hypothetical protein